MLKLNEAIDQAAEMLAQRQFDDYMGGGYGRAGGAAQSVEVLVLVYELGEQARGDIEDQIFVKQRAALEKLEEDHRAAFKAHILK